MDSYGDIVVKGAFAETIEAARKRKINLYSSHNWQDAKELIGSIVELREDEYGLWFRAVVSEASSAQDIAIKSREGHLNEVSIGYIPLEKEREVRGPGDAVTYLTKIDLLEISLVTRAANEAATVVQVKQQREESIMSDDMKETNDQELDAVHKAQGASEKASEEVLEQKQEQTEQKEPEMDQKAYDALMAKFSDLEAKMQEPVRTPREMEVEAKAEEKKVEAKADPMDLLVKTIGGSKAAEAEYKNLSSEIARDGGLVAPEEIQNVIYEQRYKANKLRSLVDEIPVSGAIGILDLLVAFSVNTHQEHASITSNASELRDILGKSGLDPHDKTIMFPIPNKLKRRMKKPLLEALVRNAVRAQMEELESKLVTGTGLDEGLGFATFIDAMGVNTETITALANLDHDAVVSCAFNLQEQYRREGVWLVGRGVHEQLMKMVDSQGRPMYALSMRDGEPGRLLNYPVIEVEAMATPSTSGDTVALFVDPKIMKLAMEIENEMVMDESINRGKDQTTLFMRAAHDFMPIDKNGISQIEIA